MEDERGFTLIETMLAVFVLSLTLITCTGLWRAAQSTERQSELLFQLSREAVNQMEAWQLELSPLVGTTTREWRWQQVTVTETKSVQTSDGLWKLTLTYLWQEGGGTREQTWATLRLQ